MGGTPERKTYVSAAYRSHTKGIVDAQRSEKTASGFCTAQIRSGTGILYLSTAPNLSYCIYGLLVL